MKVLVAKEAVASEFKNTFTVSIETFRGDLDQFHTIEIPVKSEDAPALEHVLAKIRRMVTREYHLVADADKFFGREEFDPTVSFDLEHWPKDYEVDKYYTYDGHQYFYYNRSGKKFHAQIEDL